MGSRHIPPERSPQTFPLCQPLLEQKKQFGNDIKFVSGLRLGLEIGHKVSKGGLQ